MANTLHTIYRSDRCNDHQSRETLPPLCPICQRISVECQILEKTVDALLTAGFALNVNNGGDAPELLVPTTNRKKLLAYTRATDEDLLIVYRSGERVGWVRFIYGNTGWDVISDYTTNLDDVL